MFVIPALFAAFGVETHEICIFFLKSNGLRTYRYEKLYLAGEKVFLLQERNFAFSCKKMESTMLYRC